MLFIVSLFLKLMKKVMLMVMAILLTGTTLFAANHAHTVADSTKSKKVNSAKVQYTCPMHPDVLSDKPGKCPKPLCGMTLVKKEAGKKPAAKKM
jgi:hypothetical protein